MIMRCFQEAGVDEVIVYCVNDGAVMLGWEKDQGVKRGSSGKSFYKGKETMVSFMGDTRSELTQALDMVLDDAGVMGVLGNPRCKRFALVRARQLSALWLSGVLRVLKRWLTRGLPRS